MLVAGQGIRLAAQACDSEGVKLFSSHMPPPDINQSPSQKDALLVCE